jgi:uncharacterized protein YfaS (alpha-2-macroglobulin family)
VDIKALDANEQPITTEGTVKVTRDYWWEIWVDPSGREVKGEELRALQRNSPMFPPMTARGSRQWQLKFRGYQHDDIATQTIKTDTEGNGQVTFVADREGYYRVSWQSGQGVDPRRDRFLPPVKAETTVFVATNATTDLGYRHDGVEIVVDKDTFRAGQTAPIMINTPDDDRYVLFSVEADDLYSYRLVHVTGNTKLIELPIEERYVPNIYLNAAMVRDGALSIDSKQVVIPPVRQFLSVDVKSDREQYQPREEGTLTISTRDADGHAVPAEIALGITDQSVKYIQADYAGDPRQFYYGTKRGQLVQTQSTFNQKVYAWLVDNGQGQLRDRKDNNEEDGRGYAKSINKSYSVGGAVVESVEVSAADSILEMKVGNARAKAPLLAGEGGGDRELRGLMVGRREQLAQEPAVQVRSDFRSTILWQPDVKTDGDGHATVKIKYPDSLTTWEAVARVVTAGNQFGIGNAATRTKQPLIVRLQAPRFFVVGDQVTVSAVINNNTDQSMPVTPSLSAEGLTVAGLIVDGKTLSASQRSLKLSPTLKQELIGL